MVANRERCCKQESREGSVAVEFNDASEQEKTVQLCNSGEMALEVGILRKYLPYSVISSDNTTKSNISRGGLYRYARHASVSWLVCSQRKQKANVLCLECPGLKVVSAMCMEDPTWADWSIIIFVSGLCCAPLKHRQSNFVNAGSQAPA